MGAERRLIVLRHGETTYNTENRWQGHLDVPLSDIGVAQARRAAAILAGAHPTRIMSSDLSRASRTAAEVASLVGLEVETDPRLREINVGEWAGMLSSEVSALYPEDAAALLRGEDIARGESGETLADVSVRVSAAVQEILDAMDRQDRVLVSMHGLSARCFVATVLERDVTEVGALLGGLGNAHWAVLTDRGRGWRLDRWNASAAAAAL